MNVGDYVRTKSYGIKKIYGFSSTLEEDFIDCDYDKYQKVLINKKDVVKSSPKILDLIQVGDIVNRVLVESIYQREKDKLYIHSFDTEIMMCFTNNNINSIVTKEQFESMEYKVGE